MRQNPSLDGPLKATRRLSQGYGGQQGVARRPCEGLNPHRTASGSPNLRLSETLPESSEDSGMISWGGSRIDA